jgi:hypothetical protein
MRFDYENLHWKRTIMRAHLTLGLMRCKFDDSAEIIPISFSPAAGAAAAAPVLTVGHRLDDEARILEVQIDEPGADKAPPQPGLLLAHLSVLPEGMSKARARVQQALKYTGVSAPGSVSQLNSVMSKFQLAIEQPARIRFDEQHPPDPPRRERIISVLLDSSRQPTPDTVVPVTAVCEVLDATSGQWNPEKTVTPQLSVIDPAKPRLFKNSDPLVADGGLYLGLEPTRFVLGDGSPINGGALNVWTPERGDLIFRHEASLQVQASTQAVEATFTVTNRSTGRTLVECKRTITGDDVTVKLVTVPAGVTKTWDDVEVAMKVTDPSVWFQQSHLTELTKPVVVGDDGVAQVKLPLLRAEGKDPFSRACEVELQVQGFTYELHLGKLFWADLDPIDLATKLDAQVLDRLAGEGGTLTVAVTGVLDDLPGSRPSATVTLKYAHGAVRIFSPSHSLDLTGTVNDAGLLTFEFPDQKGKTGTGQSVPLPGGVSLQLCPELAAPLRSTLEAVEAFQDVTAKAGATESSVPDLANEYLDRVLTEVGTKKEDELQIRKDIISKRVAGVAAYLPMAKVAYQYQERTTKLRGQYINRMVGDFLEVSIETVFLTIFTAIPEVWRYFRGTGKEAATGELAEVAQSLTKQVDEATEVMVKTSRDQLEQATKEVAEKEVEILQGLAQQRDVAREAVQSAGKQLDEALEVVVDLQRQMAQRPLRRIFEDSMSRVRQWLGMAPAKPTQLQQVMDDLVLAQANAGAKKWEREQLEATLKDLEILASARPGETDFYRHQMQTVLEQWNARKQAVDAVRARVVEESADQARRFLDVQTHLGRLTELKAARARLAGIGQELATAPAEQRRFLQDVLAATDTAIGNAERIMVGLEQSGRRWGAVIDFGLEGVEFTLQTFNGWAWNDIQSHPEDYPASVTEPGIASPTIRLKPGAAAPTTLDRWKKSIAEFFAPFMRWFSGIITYWDEYGSSWSLYSPISEGDAMTAVQMIAKVEVYRDFDLNRFLLAEYTRVRAELEAQQPANVQQKLPAQPDRATVDATKASMKQAAADRTNRASEEGARLGGAFTVALCAHLFKGVNFTDPVSTALSTRTSDTLTIIQTLDADIKRYENNATKDSSGFVESTVAEIQDCLPGVLGGSGGTWSETAYAGIDLFGWAMATWLRISAFFATVTVVGAPVGLMAKYGADLIDLIKAGAKAAITTCWALPQIQCFIRDLMLVQGLLLDALLTPERSPTDGGGSPGPIPGRLSSESRDLGSQSAPVGGQPQ